MHKSASSTSGWICRRWILIFRCVFLACSMRSTSACFQSIYGLEYTAQSSSSLKSGQWCRLQCSLGYPVQRQAELSSYSHQSSQCTARRNRERLIFFPTRSLECKATHIKGKSKIFSSSMTGGDVTLYRTTTHEFPAFQRDEFELRTPVIGEALFERKQIPEESHFLFRRKH